jgi:hypothetical protein
MKKLRLFIHPNLFLPAFAGSFFFKDKATIVHENYKEEKTSSDKRNLVKIAILNKKR